MQEEKLNSRKQNSLAHSIIKAGRLINEKSINTARELYNLPNLTIAHLELFPFIDFNGTSIGEIARRKKVSKQSVSKLVNQMISMNILYLTESPDDKRKKLVHFHTEGPMAISQGFKALESIDTFLIEFFDKETYKKILANLNRLLDELD